ncbi:MULTISPECIES: hypothetical protein [Rhodopseudomonas]|uniref:Uncharacterized protein n=1 Tax=Rhodopseudomonas palustris TaxID=1076 RepID=A0A0D7EEI0_RHOPL|nr:MULTISPECIES: hypothetical protein [Rhodopseudomonas]KIZ39056.1 hypothetical protein OO17_21600 [Rhodopseudomonas palustris]MDF3809283.1 hypothetical protein [Rhodopseudomonas sp. BAL398]WOK20613.1 hypothetical protein RBJ75_05810 [Rhodopseudomonas sp. BAL398]
MIVVRVELHSAISGKVTEIARMLICNIGGTNRRGNYQVETLRGRDKEALDRRSVNRKAVVTNYPRLDLHVWHLVARALLNMSYADEKSALTESQEP